MLHAATLDAAANVFESIELDWQPFTWQDAPYHDDTSPTILLTGSVYGGKSTVAAQKVHRHCRDIHGSFWIAGRKTRESCTDSVALALEEAIGGAAEHVPSHSRFRYPNGSVIVYMGMSTPKERQKIRSIGHGGGVDGIWLDEGTQFLEADFEAFASRLRGKRGPCQMLIGCNPDSPGHWINQRLILGNEAKVYYSHITDNPTASDAYRQRLDTNLTGVEHDRMVKGHWVTADGIVHDAWDQQRNLIDRFPIPSDWRRIGSIDFGFDHPACIQWWALDGDDRAYLYREIYKSHYHIDDMIGDITRLSAGENVTFHVDHAAGIRLRGVPCVAANKAVQPGLLEVNGRMKVAGDGKPRLFIFRDALAHPPDQRQKQAYRPTCTAEEIPGYVWEVGASDGWSKDQPLKRNDDGCDAMRYAMMAAKRPRHFVMGAGGETMLF